MRPATPIDSTFLRSSITTHRQPVDRDASNRGSVMSANYGPGQLHLHAMWHVVAVCGANTTIYPADLFPVPTSSTAMMWWASADTVHVGGDCIVGDPIDSCLRPFSNSTKDTMVAHAASEALELYHVVPVLPECGGLVLLGEVSKFVPVSGINRVTSIACSGLAAANLLL